MLDDYSIQVRRGTFRIRGTEYKLVSTFGAWLQARKGTYEPLSAFESQRLMIQLARHSLTARFSGLILQALSDQGPAIPTSRSKLPPHVKGPNDPLHLGLDGYFDEFGKLPKLVVLRKKRALVQGSIHVPKPPKQEPILWNSGPKPATLTWVGVRVEDHRTEAIHSLSFRLELTNGQVSTGELSNATKERFSLIPEGDCILSIESKLNEA